MKDKNNKKLKHHAIKLLQETLAINVVEERVYRIGRENSGNARPILVQFSRESDKICLKSAPKLKGTKIFINEDLSRATLDIRRRKLDDLKERLAQGYIVYFRGINIITKAIADNAKDVIVKTRGAKSAAAVSKKKRSSKNPANLSITLVAVFHYSFKFFYLLIMDLAASRTIYAFFWHR